MKRIGSRGMGGGPQWELYYWQRLRMMLSGLAKPHDSGEYKQARTELQRQIAPLAAVLLPAACILVLTLLSRAKTAEEWVTIIPVEPTLYPQTPLKPLEPFDPLPQRVEPLPDVFPGPSIAQKPALPPPDRALATDPAPPPERPVQIHKKPVILQGFLGRRPETREKILSTYSSAEQTERAVMRALRWLKTRQASDGSWPPNKPAMTALAVLCYLAHGEQPDESEEFGGNVRRGIEFLIRSQAADGRWHGNYEHYIVTYALCEAYGMTQNPNVRAAAERAVRLMIEGQHDSGGWDYGLKAGDRDDTSVMGWAAQALKAAHMAGFYSNPAALQRASKLAVKGFQRNAHPAGGFGYTGPARGGLSSVGTLCMQFHGAGDYPEVRKTLEILDAWPPVWNGSRQGRRLSPGEKPPEIAGVPGPSTQYYYYYATQAMFQFGGTRWKKWNAVMWPEYVKAQFVEEKAIADPKGERQDIGWWENADQSGADQRPMMDTCLAALQLMVYYRYLPTFQAVDQPGKNIAAATDAADINVDVNL